MAGYDRITPEGERFLRELEELAKLEVFVGYQYGESREENGADTAEVAAYNELGAPNINIPSRPFMRNAVDKNMDKINVKMNREVEKMMQGGTARICLRQIGDMGVNLIWEEIIEGVFKENAEETKRRKGSDRPLVDKGTMRQAVHHVIRLKGEGG